MVSDLGHPDAKGDNEESDGNLNKNRGGRQIFESLRARIENRSVKSGKPCPSEKERGGTDYLRRDVLGKR